MVYLPTRLSLPFGVQPPDLFPFGFDSFPQDHVVSRDKSGKVISRVGDLVWDLTIFHAHGRVRKLYFDYWNSSAGRKCDLKDIPPERLKRVRELQELICCILHSKSKAPICVSSLRNYMFYARKVALYSEKIQMGLFEFLGNTEQLDLFIQNCPANDAAYLRGLLNSIRDLGDNAPIQLIVTPTWTVLSKRNKAFTSNRKQVAPLPTRIYSIWIANLDSELSLIESHMDRLIPALRKAINLWTEEGLSGKKKFERIKFGKKVINDNSLITLMDRYRIKQDLVGLGSLIQNIYLLCKYQIHTFTGMRSEEALYLPFDCIKTEGKNGRVISIIEGVTTKLNNGKKRRAQWVTTEEDGCKAVKIAQKLASVIYEALDIRPGSNSIARDNQRLFISTDYLPWNQRRNFEKSGASPLSVSTNLLFTNPRYKIHQDRLVPKIQIDDIDELEDIDPFRSWHEEEEYQIGARWTIKAHQFRRSLALYARVLNCINS